MEGGVQSTKDIPLMDVKHKREASDWIFRSRPDMYDSLRDSRLSFHNPEAMENE